MARALGGLTPRLYAAAEARTPTPEIGTRVLIDAFGGRISGRFAGLAAVEDYSGRLLWKVKVTETHGPYVGRTMTVSSHQCSTPEGWTP